MSCFLIILSREKGLFYGKEFEQTNIPESLHVLACAHPPQGTRNTITDSNIQTLSPRLLRGERRMHTGYKSSIQNMDSLPRVNYCCTHSTNNKTRQNWNSLKVSDRTQIGKWFEPRSISYLFGVIVQVKVVFLKTTFTRTITPKKNTNSLKSNTFYDTDLQ